MRGMWVEVSVEEWECERVGGRMHPASYGEKEKKERERRGWKSVR